MSAHMLAAEDFSAGKPTENWEYYSSSATYGRIEVVSGRLRMDVTTNGNDSLNEAIYSVDLAGATSATLSFQQIDTNDEETALSAIFSGHYNGDGVAISADGSTWYTVVNAVELNEGSLTDFNVDLISTRDSIRLNYDNTFSLTSDFKIKFQQYGDSVSPSGGREWDSVEVLAEFPVFHTVTFNLGAYGTLTTGELIQSVVEGEGAVEPVLTVSNGWTFLDWDNAYENISEDIVITAEYVPTSLLGILEKKITASDGTQRDNFSASVSISGDTVVVGAYQDGENGSNTGSAYVFVRSGEDWIEQAKLTASDAALGDQFGLAVGVSGDTVVVSAHNDDDHGKNSGSVYVFTRSGDVWSEQQKLTASDAAEDDEFGLSLDVCKDTVVVGVPYNSDHGDKSGSAYVFTRSDGVWTEQAKLIASDAAQYAQFGRSIGINEDTLVLGAPYDADGAYSNGSAYVFTRSDGVWIEQAKLTASDAAERDYFAYSVSISGDTIISGAYFDDDDGDGSGSAYIFRRSGSVWTEEAKLTASDAAIRDFFGFSVGISGDAAIIGAYTTDDQGSGSGSAYLYTYTGGVWVEKTELTANDGAASDLFGQSVSISGDAIVISSKQDDDNGGNSGSAYIYEFNIPPVNVTFDLADKGTRVGGGELVQLVQVATEVIPPNVDPIPGWYFNGWDVDLSSIDSDATIIAQYLPIYSVNFDLGDNGIRTGGGELTQTVPQGFAAAEPVVAAANGYYFNDWDSDPSSITSDITLTAQYLNTYTVTFDLGAYGTLASGELVQSIEEGGSAVEPELNVSDDWAFFSWDHAYDNITEDVTITAQYVPASLRSHIIGQATFEGKLLADDGALNDNFSNAVSVSGDTVVIGAHSDDDKGPNSGSAYVFIYSGGQWLQQAKLVPSDGNDYDRFGHSVSVSGDTVVVGAYNDRDENGYASGSAYVFFRSGNQWSEQVKLVPSDGDVNDQFGRSVSVDDDTIAVGASYESNVNGSYAGSVYLFIRSGNLWSEQAKLIASDGTASDRFGVSVDLDDNTVVIGADYDAANGYLSGSAYVFVRSGNQWSEEAKLTASDGDEYRYFGYSVGLSGDTVVVGSYASSGSAYVYERTGSQWLEEQKLIANDGDPSDQFGYSVSIDGDVIAVGARGDDGGGSNTGSAYVFNREGYLWQEVFKLTAYDATPSDLYGSAISVRDQKIVVSAHLDDDNGFSSGSAYIYSYTSSFLLPATVIFNLAGKGTRTSGGELFQYVRLETAATAPIVDENPGWLLTGWDADFSSVTSDLTVTAQYAEANTVTFDLAGKGTHSGGGDLSQVILYGSAALAPLVNPDTGWTFDGWDVDFDTVTTDLTVVAQYSPVTYTVTFDLDGKSTHTGGGALVQSLAHGTSAIVPIFDVDPAWSFASWDLDFSSITGDLTVTAQYNAVMYTVTFDLAGKGTRSGGGELSQTIQYGSSALAPIVTPNSFWNFIGWDVAFDAVTADLTVVAQYSPVVYTVTFALGDEGSRTGGGELVQSVDHGTSAVAPIFDVDPAWSFSSWDLDFSSVTGDLTITAQYSPVLHTVTFDLGTNGSRSGGGELSQVIQHGNAALAPTVTPDAGWNFDGWDVAFDSVTADLTVVAQYSPVVYTITFALGDEGSRTGGGELVQSVDHGTSAVAPIFDVDPAWSFSSWDLDFSSVTGDLTTTAQYSPVLYTVTFDLDGKGSRSGGGELSQTIQYGNAALVPTVTPNTGWYFYGWDVDFSSVTGDITVTALFIPGYIVTFDLGTYGSLLNGALIQSVPQGGTAKAPELSSADTWSFVGWDQDYSNVQSDMTVSAQYAPIDLVSVLEGNHVGSDTAEYDSFGTSVSICGDTALVGAIGDDDNGLSSGSAYVFVRVEGNWLEQAKLLPSDGARNNLFGHSVYVHGDTALVSASNKGTVYVFVRRDGVWTEQAKLTNSDDPFFNGFGNSVSLSGNTALIGAYGDFENGWESGRAYVFTRNGDVWTEQAKLLPSDIIAGDRFGAAVSVQGDTALVGASYNSGTGSVYVFTRNSGAWTEQAKFVSSDSAIDDYFGRSISMSGDTALIGANGNDDGGTSSGSAYIFEKVDSVWTEQTKLTLSDGADHDIFGVSVSLSGDFAIVGASGDDGIGSAYVYVRRDGLWSEKSKLRYSGSSINAQFGTAVGVSGDTALVGARFNDVIDTSSGSVHFYDLGVPPVTVSFDLDGKGTRTNGGELSQLIPYGTAAEAPTVTPDAGWNFDGWDAAFDAVTADLTVIAQYSPVTYTVTFDLGDEGTRTGGGTLVQSVDHGTSAIVPIFNVDPAWSFASWDLDFSSITEDLTITAQYSPVVYTVTFDLDEKGSRSGGGELSQLIPYGTAAEAPTVTPDTGWNFDGWDVAFDAVTADLTVVAQYSPVTYTVTFDLGDEGTRTGGGTLVQSVDHGTSAIVPIFNVDPAWSFDSWDVNFSFITGDLTVTAQYSPALYTVTFDLDGKGTRSGDGELSQIIQHGSAALSPLVTPNAGWRFIGWDISFDTIYGNLTVTATYVPLLELLPAQESIAEDAGDLSFTLLAAVVPSTDILVSLSSSDTASITVPETVTLLAGENSVSFNGSLVDNTKIDGTRTSTITASAFDWVADSIDIEILDDEDLLLTLIIPETVNEADDVLQVAWVSISGTLQTDLSISLASDDLTEIVLPSPSIVIPAGSMSAGFALEPQIDGLPDGAQDVSITASASGFISASDTLSVKDSDLNHFEFDPISISQIASASFPVSIKAKTIDGAIISTFSGDVDLSAMGDSGTLIVSTDVVTFADGIWSGSLSIAAVDSNVILSASSGEQSGDSNAFELAHGPVAYFDWSPIPATLYEAVPISAIVTAKDANGFTVTSFVDTVQFDARVAGGSPTVRILAFTANADLSREYPNTLTAISTYFTDYTVTTTNTGDAATLATLLENADVFLIPEQEKGSSSSYAVAFASVLNTFVDSGGTVIVCTHTKDEHQFLTRSGLMNISTSGYAGSTSVRKIAEHPLTEGIADVFYNPFLNKYTTTDATVVVEVTDGSFDVVFYREVGLGRAIVISSDYYTIGTDMDRILANAVQWGEYPEFLPISPSTSTSFTDGVWAGDLVIDNIGSDVSLIAENTDGITGASALFDVLTRPVYEVTFDLDGKGTRIGGGALTQSVLYLNSAIEPIFDALPAWTFDSWDVDFSSVTSDLTITAQYSPAFYTVTFDLDGKGTRTGGGELTQTVQYGNSAVPPTFSVSPDWHFTGWSTDFSSISEDTVVTAQYASLMTLEAVVANVSEDAGDLAFTLEADLVSTKDITITLTSNDPASITVPGTIVLPAGENSVSFNASLIDNAMIDGTRTATITASVGSWTAGSEDIIIFDDEILKLTVSIPEEANEADGVLHSVGIVSISGTYPTDLVVGLISDGTSELTLPSTSVTIPAGSTSVSFDLEPQMDGYVDGAQLVTVVAFASGFDAGFDTIIINDSDFDHFEINAIAVEQTASVPFTVTLTAKSIDGITISSFDSTLALDASGDSGDLLVTPESVTFVDGQWSGSVSIAAVDTNVVLSASLAEETVSSNAFTLSHGAVNYFELSPIPVTQYEGQPISLTVTAKDANGFNATFYQGSADVFAEMHADDEYKLLDESFGGYSGIGSAGYSYHAGHRFRLDEEIIVTHIEHYYGTHINLFSESDQSLLFSLPVISTGTSWTKTALSTPIRLQPGNYRLVGRVKSIPAVSDGTGYVRFLQSSTYPISFPSGQILESVRNFTDPSVTIDYSSTFGDSDDDRFLISLSYNKLSDVPTVDPDGIVFSDGVWSGSFSIGEALDDVQLKIEDGALSGISNLFNVIRPPEYTVTFDLGAYGIRTGGGELSQIVEEGTGAVEPILDVVAGWQFTGWDVDFSSVTSDLVVTAQYNPIYYTVTFDLGAYGTRTGGGELNQTVQHSSAALEPEFDVSLDWRFDSWDTDFSAVTTDLTITAVYLPRISMTVMPIVTTINASENAVIKVSADVEGLTYQWYEGGSGDTSQPVPGANGNLLVSPPLLESKSFWVRVSDGVKVVGSESIWVTVNVESYDLKAIGSDQYGQLGVLGYIKTPTPVWSDVIQVSAGGAHTLMITSDGNLWGFGSNYRGQLGIGNAGFQRLPVLITSDVSKAAAGEAHTLFLKKDGTLWSMGDNIKGQLCVNDRTVRYVPVQVASAVEDIEVGTKNSFFIKTDKTLWGCGANEMGQLGDGTVENHTSPILVASDVTKVAASSDHTLVLKTDGTLWSVGANRNGQLGVGDEVNRSVFVQCASAVRDVVVGGEHSLFIKENNTLWGMGLGHVGQLGGGSYAEHLSPVQISSYVAQVEAQKNSTFFIKENGNLWAMGSNSYGQLGDGTTVNRFNPVRIATDASLIASGDYYSFYVSNDGVLKAFGSNAYGQLGTLDAAFRTDPVSVDSDVISVSSGRKHTLYLKSDGTLWASGSNTYGQLGHGGGYVQEFTPILVAENVTQMSAGEYHSLFVKSDGTLWSMGFNSHGQLGNGTTFTNYLAAPKQIASQVAKVDAAYFYSLFIKTDGSLWAMGSNSHGQIGYGLPDRSLTPVEIESDVIQISVGYSHSLFIRSDQSLWGVGINKDGQLGDGTKINRDMAVEIASNVRKAIAGHYHSFFITMDGSLWGMGANEFGELGDGTLTQKILPIQVAENVADVSANRFHSMFAKNDQTLWAMGENDYGQLGDGTTTNRLSPVQVATDVVAGETGYLHSMFLQKPGTYSVYFNLAACGTRSGGGELIQTLKEGTDAIAPIVAVSSDWTFTGWDVDFSSVTSDLTVTAQYTPVSHIVTFDLGAHGTRTSGGELTQNIQNGNAAVAPIFDVAVGWQFLGWDATFDRVTSDIVITAQYSQLYTVTFDLGSYGHLLNGELIQAVQLGGTAVAPEISVSGGWSFVGWDRTFSDVSGDLNVIAQYAPSSLVSILESSQFASDRSSHDKFGSSVSISHDTAVVGAYGNDDNGDYSGSAYVFVRRDDVWIEQVKLVPSDNSVGDNFGRSVSISGNTIVIGTSSNIGKNGSAYVYVRSDGTWIEQAKLEASDGAAGDRFGRSVSISGDTIVLGASDDDDHGRESGSAYVFVRRDDVWIEQAKLTASDADAQRYFGVSVSISDDTALVGAIWDDDNGDQSGSVYVYVRSDDKWIEQTKLTASDGDIRNYFGISVSVSGDSAVVGSYGDDENGSFSGSAYVYKRSGEVWTEQAKLIPDDASMGDNFGESVAISGDTVLIGAYGNDENGSNSGSSYIYVRSSNDWIMETKLMASDAISGHFGTSVSIRGDLALIGASASSGGGNIYFYDLGVSPATVTFDLDGKASRTGGGELSQQVKLGTAALAPMVESNPGLNFTGWDVDFSNVTSDITVTAQYRPLHIVTFDLGSNGVRTGGGELTQYIIDSNEALAPMIEVDPGWIFTGWDLDFSVVTTDMNVTAEYLPRHKQFGYVEHTSHIEITYYPDSATGKIVIPKEINGKPVTSIEANVFNGLNGIKSIVIPASVDSIGDGAFANMSNLISIYFHGDAPSVGLDSFLNTTATVYYFSDKIGFTSPTWQGLTSESMGVRKPAKVWLTDHGLSHDEDLSTDPLGNGVALLTPYALNLPPSMKGMPEPVVDDSEFATNFYTGRDDVTYTIETSTDMINWTSTGVTLEDPDGDGYSEVKVAKDGTIRFIRITVSQD